MFIHTFYTWLLANLLQPLLISCFVLLFGEQAGYYIHISDGVSLFLLLVSSLGYSLPCLLLGWFCLRIICALPYSIITRYMLWLITAAGLVILEAFFLLVFTYPGHSGLVVYAVPGVIAAGISVIFRFTQFRALICSTPNQTYETSQV
jgi:hypothetical protein